MVKKMFYAVKTQTETRQTTVPITEVNTNVHFVVTWSIAHSVSVIRRDIFHPYKQVYKLFYVVDNTNEKIAFTALPFFNIITEKISLKCFMNAASVNIINISHIAFDALHTLGK